MCTWLEPPSSGVLEIPVPAQAELDRAGGVSIQ